MVLLQTFHVKKLHGKKNISLFFRDNKLLLIGENGSGKTTILNLFYYFVTIQWDKLLNVNFENIELTFIDEKKKSQEILINKSEIELLIGYLGDPFGFYGVNSVSPTSVMSFLKEAIIEEYFSDDPDVFTVIKKLDRVVKKLRSILVTYEFIYLPTYRHSENNFINKLLSNIKLEQHVKEQIDNYRNQYEFGMDSIEEAINREKQRAQTRMQVLYSQSIGNILAHTLNNQSEHSEEMGDEKKEIIKILNLFMHNLKIQGTKRKFSDTEYIEIANKMGKDKTLYSLYTEWKNIAHEVEIQTRYLQNFFNACNSYFNDKEFSFHEITLDWDLKLHDDKKKSMELNKLSSGEQQLVSIFCKIYLREAKAKIPFILLDEPEISLSIEWQERFLNELLYEDTGGLVATHSPVIYQNYNGQKLDIQLDLTSME